jgi:hypothetical protein
MVAPAERREAAPGSGRPEGGALVYADKAGTGFSAQSKPKVLKVAIATTHRSGLLSRIMSSLLGKICSIVPNAEQEC